MRGGVIILIFLFFYFAAYPQQATDYIRSGNEAYKKQEFTKATEEYEKALSADPSSITAKFNKANSVYKQDKKVEAAEQFSAITRSATDKETRSKAFYNKGVILSQQKNLEESIEAYKSALRINPEDKEARENLQKALLELKKKQPPKKESEQQKKKQQEQQKKQQQPKMSRKEADQRLKLLQQKEKQVQQKMQKEKSKSGGSQAKDW
jgi:Ca-activated chloride channel homolog